MTSTHANYTISNDLMRDVVILMQSRGDLFEDLIAESTYQFSDELMVEPFLENFKIPNILHGLKSDI